MLITYKRFIQKQRKFCNMSSVSLPMNIMQSAIVVPSLWNHPSTVNQSIHLVRPLPQRTNEHNTNYPSKSSSYCNSKKHVNQKLKLKSQSNILTGRATVFPHLQRFLHTYIHARAGFLPSLNLPKKKKPSQWSIHLMQLSCSSLKEKTRPATSNVHKD